MLYFVNNQIIAVVLNVSLSTARKKCVEIRAHYNLQDHQKISLGNFCKYMGISKEEFIETSKQHAVLKTYL